MLSKPDRVETYDTSRRYLDPLINRVIEKVIEQMELEMHSC